MKPSNYITMLIFLLSGSLVPLRAQSQTPEQLLNGVYQKMLKAKDYKVDATITVDIPHIKMAPVTAVIYSKQKDKFKVESKSIAIVPRQGFNQVFQLLADKNAYTAVNSGTEAIAGTTATIVNVIPSADTTDLILGKFWIDPKQSLVLKSQLTTRNNGTIVAEYAYGTQAAYGLPDNMTFIVEVKKFKIPKGVATDINTSGSQKTDERKNGKIYIKLTNYVLNKGIPDEKFK